VLKQRVTRLSEGQLSKAIASLLKVAPPVLTVGTVESQEFLPSAPSPVTGTLGAKLQEAVEEAAKKAVGTFTCSGDERTCAGRFIDAFAVRAFRRSLSAQERSELLAVYDAGRTIEGNYAGGASLVAEAVLQSPSFVYLAEVGVPAVDSSQFRLSDMDVASKVSLFLTGELPDDELWAAAVQGRLDDQELSRQVDRLFQKTPTQQFVNDAFFRYFKLSRLEEAKKAPSVSVAPGLIEAMRRESAQLIEDVLWKKSGTIGELLMTRSARVDAVLADVYGVQRPSSGAEIELPPSRAGLLTRAAVLTANASPTDSDVIHRGLLVYRGLLCAEPPQPDAAAVAAGLAQQKSIYTERGRADARASMGACFACHAFFDPLGIPFEGYDTLGRERSSIDTPNGPVPVDAAIEVKVADLRVSVRDGVELSRELSKSRAVRQCVAQKMASLAYGERLRDQDACAVAPVAARFESTGGDLRALLKDVALWQGLRMRKAE
jgi:hypothetical protein